MLPETKEESHEELVARCHEIMRQVSGRAMSGASHEPRAKRVAVASNVSALGQALVTNSWLTVFVSFLFSRDPACF